MFARNICNWPSETQISDNFQNNQKPKKENSEKKNFPEWKVRHENISVNVSKNS